MLGLEERGEGLDTTYIVMTIDLITIRVLNERSWECCC